MLKEATRSATVAWNPVVGRRPALLAAGTIAGTMSMDFDPTGSLEIFSLDLEKPGSEMTVLGKIETGERMQRLAWSNLGSTGTAPALKYGLLAGGLANGAINIWNPTALIEYVLAVLCFRFS
jgi:protein transport protein SEC31